MNWFRVYIDARNDAKLRTLTDAEHRVWFHLLCYAAEQPNRGTIEGVTGVTGVTDVTSALLLAIEVANGDTALLTKTVEKLINLRVLSIDDDGLSFINFTKRQYDKPSDMPDKTRERKAAQRERERATSGENPPPNNGMSRDVTPSHTTEQNRTEQSKADTEEKREETEPEQTPQTPKGEPPAGLTSLPGGKQTPAIEKRFDVFWAAYPRKVGKQAALKVWKGIKPDAELADEILTAIDQQKHGRNWLRNGGQYIPNPATWLGQGRWEDEVLPPEVEPRNGTYRGKYIGLTNEQLDEMIARESS